VKFVEGVAQGRHQGVPKDVNASDLPGSRARSAVFLVHAESPRQARGGFREYREAAGRLALRSGCYHSRSMGVL
jgi:hypothetical protein